MVTTPGCPSTAVSHIRPGLTIQTAPETILTAGSTSSTFTLPACRYQGGDEYGMSRTLYRRPLPSQAIAFSSPEGRQVFTEALATEGLDGYFPLAEQFHTQSDPAFCGLGSLVVALNALAIDPGRLWKGPWRWFAEDLLDCCVPLAEVRERGLDLDELACLARCNGAKVAVAHADVADASSWRSAITEA